MIFIQTLAIGTQTNELLTIELMNLFHHQKMVAD
jgi:hypothetical protein